MSTDLLATAGLAYLALLGWWCAVRYIQHYEPRGEHPRRHLHGTPRKYKVRRG